MRGSMNKEKAEEDVESPVFERGRAGFRIGCNPK
jgi:hypothetical protein